MTGPAGFACALCKFYAPVQSALGENDTFGHCRRRAPAASDHPHDYTDAIWPRVDQIDWCGDGQRRVPQEVEAA